MKELLVLIAVLGIANVSCASKKSAAQEDPYAGVTLITEWGAGPGIEAFADYGYATGALFGESEDNLALHSFVNSEKGTVLFVTDADSKVIASLEIPKSDIAEGQGMLYDGVYENFDPAKNYDNEKSPYYVVIRTVDTEYRTFSPDVVKAWRFDPEAGAFEEVSAEGLWYMSSGNDWV